MAPLRTAAEDRAASAAVRMQALYDAHAKAVYWFLLQLTLGERHAAEDLLQETMLRAWRNIEDLNADIDSLRPWLITVARRIAIDAGRARKARPQEVGSLDLAAMPVNDDVIDRMLMAVAIRQAMKTLSPHHRSVLIEIYFHGRSTGEAASILRIPEGTVKSRVYYAVRALRAAIGSTAAMR